LACFSLLRPRWGKAATGLAANAWLVLGARIENERQVTANFGWCIRSVQFL